MPDNPIPQPPTPPAATATAGEWEVHRSKIAAWQGAHAYWLAQYHRETAEAQSAAYKAATDANIAASRAGNEASIAANRANSDAVIAASRANTEASVAATTAQTAALREATAASVQLHTDVGGIIDRVGEIEETLANLPTGGGTGLPAGTLTWEQHLAALDRIDKLLEPGTAG